MAIRQTFPDIDQFIIIFVVLIKNNKIIETKYILIYILIFKDF